MDFKSMAFSVSAGTEKAVYNVSSFVGESVSSVRELWDLKAKYNELTKQLEKYELLERSNADIKERIMNFVPFLNLPIAFRLQISLQK